MNWSSGYFTDLGYVGGYQSELNPEMLKLACLCAGIAPQTTEQPAYLELGYGQGLSINIHAAANSGRFWGTDFHPTHTTQARHLASAFDADLTLTDDSFAEFAARTDLPDFDFIALHGVWSWISKENQSIIVDLIRRRLRPGGLVYISFNCLPGWAPIIPIRQLMLLGGSYAPGKAAGSMQMIEDGIAFVDRIIDSDSMYFRMNPAACQQWDRIKKEHRQYIAHEYLNQDWHVERFADLACSLKEAKLSYVGPARLLERVNMLHLTAKGQEFLASIGEPILRETVRDQLTNQRFRCDIFVKGPRDMNKAEQEAAWRQRQFVLTTANADLPKRILGALGEATIDDRIHLSIVDVLSEDNYRPKTIDELMTNPEMALTSLGAVVDAIVTLVGAGYICPARSPTEAVVSNIAALNRHFCRTALESPDTNHLVSALTGGGLVVPHIWQVCIEAMARGKTTAREMALFASETFDNLGLNLSADDVKDPNGQGRLEQFTKITEHFLQRKLPILKAHGMV
jgi:SAM-dependent methyltransferase